MKNKLTALQVKNATVGKHPDGAGLYLNVREDARSWLFRFTLDGRRREMGLGSLTLSEARKARDAYAAMVAQGIDPITERAKQIEARKLARQEVDPTFEQITREVFEVHKETLRGDGKRGQWMNGLERYILPKIGKIPMSRLTSNDIQGALSPIWRTKNPTARKCYIKIHFIFKKARLKGVSCDPFIVEVAKENLGVVIHKAKNIPATRWQDIPDLYALLDAGTPTTAALRFAILTLVRSHGVRGARYEEIDGDVWTVPKERIKGAKSTVEDFRVPLTEAALDAAQSCAHWSRGYCFPGLSKGHVSDQALTKYLDRVGEAGRVHGFRTSFRSWVQDTNACDWEVAETALGQIIGGTVERAYARSDILDRRRIAMQKWADFVTGQQGKVVQLRTAGPASPVPSGLG